MEILIIVGAIWITLSTGCLWFNYRFHRYLTLKEQGLIIENQAAIKSDRMVGQLELQFSKAL